MATAQGGRRERQRSHGRVLLPARSRARRHVDRGSARPATAHLTLAGRPWATHLFSAYPWKVIAFAGSRIQALRDAKVKTGLLLTNSFSTALEFRLAGISAVGYARDARSWLLDKAVAVNASDHMVDYYHRLAATLIGTSTVAPRDLRLRMGESAVRNAQRLLAAQNVGPSYVVLCPVAVGFHRGKLKAWGNGQAAARRRTVAAMS